MRSMPLAAVQLLMEQLDDCPFFAKDRQLRYVVANSAMAKLCGIRDASDMLGRRAADFFPPHLARHYEALDRRVLATARPVTHQLESVGPPGGPAAWLVYSRTPVIEDGEVVGVAAISHRVQPGPRMRPAYERVVRAMRALRADCDRPLDLRTVARCCGVSVSQLERDFARTIERSPRHVHTMARIDRAIELLGHGMAVSRVAQDCGYSDHSAFSRRFRQIVGRTPLGYARWLRSQCVGLTKTRVERRNRSDVHRHIVS